MKTCSASDILQISHLQNCAKRLFPFLQNMVIPPFANHHYLQKLGKIIWIFCKSIKNKTALQNYDLKWASQLFNWQWFFLNCRNYWKKHKPGKGHLQCSGPTLLHAILWVNYHILQIDFEDEYGKEAEDISYLEEYLADEDHRLSCGPGIRYSKLQATLSGRMTKPIRLVLYNMVHIMLHKQLHA